MNMLKKTTWLVVGHIVGDALGFVFYLVLARAYGASDIGDYAFAFSVAGLLGIGVQFGLRALLTRSIARDRSSIHNYFGTVFVIQIGVMLALGFLLYILSEQSGFSHQLFWLLVLAFASLAITGIATSFVAYLEGIEAMDKSALLHIALRLTSAVLGLGLIFLGVSLPVVVVAHVLGSVAHLGMAWYLVACHFGPIRFTIETRLAKQIIREALPFALAAALYELYSRVDILMLHQMAGEAETGAYAVAFRLAMAPSAFAFLAGVAMFPTLSRAAFEDPKVRNALFLASLKWLALLGMTGAVLLYTVGDQLVLFLFGEEFTSAAYLVRWMSILFFIHCVITAYGRLLLAMNLEYVGLRRRALSVLFNVSLNLLLIPHWGALGAVWASIISEGLLVLTLHMLSATHVSAPYVDKALRLLFAGGVACTIGFLPEDTVSWPVLTILVLATWGLMAVIINIVTRKDYMQIREALRAKLPSDADA